MLFAKAFQDFNLLLKIPAKRRKEKSAPKGKSEKRKTQHYKTELPKSGIEKVIYLFIYLFVSSAKALIENEKKKKKRNAHTHTRTKKKRFTVMH